MLNASQAYQGRGINEAVRKGEALRCEKCLDRCYRKRPGAMTRFDLQLK